MVLELLGDRAQENGDLLWVIQVAVSPLNIFGQVGFPLVYSSPELLKCGTGLHQDAPKEPHIASCIARLIHMVARRLSHISSEH